MLTCSTVDNLNLPTESKSFNTDDITFNFTPTDQFGLSTGITCNLSLDGSVNVSGIRAISGSDNVTVIENLTRSSTGGT